MVVDQSDRRINAVVCLDTTGVSNYRDGGYPLHQQDALSAGPVYRVSAEIPDTDSDFPTTERRGVELTAPTPDESLAGPPGRDPRPSGNVFGDWQITEFKMDATRAARGHCDAWREQRWGGPTPPPPTRTELEPPTVEPFYPGWEN
ncbi:hypothetical protein G419_05412 [Rhodococcus triatomae BKS 15-14]|nr:hypothetical protein G419_05412 [Rhodococcus triatomae BKS 15-14]